MFDIGWSEIIVIAVVAIIFVGPRELIPMLRTIGKQIGAMKRMAGEFQSQFNEALREAELDTIKKDVEKIGRLDPLRDIRDKVNKDMSDVTRKLEERERLGSKPPSMGARAASTPPAPASAAQGETKADQSDSPSDKAAAKSSEKPAPSPPSEPVPAEPSKVESAS